LGELTRVTLPGGTYIDYQYDPLGRRVAKEVNDAVTEKYLWAGATTLLATFDGAGTLKQRFLYAGGRLPVAMDDIALGERFYLSYNQVGSLKIVTAADGTVVKTIQYDAFGNVIADTNPTFKVPFGFAGGLYDPDTKLVRFGARDDAV